MLCEQCGNCAYFIEIPGTNGEEGDCINEESEYYNEVMSFDDRCFDFEENIVC